MACPQRTLKSRLILPVALFLASALSSCIVWPSPIPDLTWDRKPVGVHFSTTPPGALVVIDGMQSGFATPCMLDLDEDDSYRVEFELEGYQTAGLYLSPDRRWELITFDESRNEGLGWRFPLWLPFGEFWMPIRTNTALSPSRIHMRLRLGADGLDAPPPASDEGAPRS